MVTIVQNLDPQKLINPLQGVNILFIPYHECLALLPKIRNSTRWVRCWVIAVSHKCILRQTLKKFDSELSILKALNEWDSSAVCCCSLWINYEWIIRTEPSILRIGFVLSSMINLRPLGWQCSLANTFRYHECGTTGSPQLLHVCCSHWMDEDGYSVYALSKGKVQRPMKG